jgi:hypothetical protein
MSWGDGKGKDTGTDAGNGRGRDTKYKGEGDDKGCGVPQVKSYFLQQSSGLGP